MWSKEPFKDFWRPGRSGPAGSYLEPEIDLNTCKMLCLSQKNIFALYLDDPARFAGILCPPGWIYSKTFISQLCVIPILKKSCSLGSLSFRHSNEVKKTEGGHLTTPPPPTVKG